MLYHPHPLDDEGVVVYQAHPTHKYSSSQNGGIPALSDHVLSDEPSFSTIHHLDKCRDCHAYIKHVDHTLSTNPTLRLNHSKHGTYLEGIEVGQRLQLEEDDMHLSRYRSRLQASRKREDELRLAQDQYRYQVERLERDMAVLQDRLMAMQMAYDDIVEDRMGEGRLPPHSHFDFASFGAESHLESPRIANSNLDPLHASPHGRRSSPDFDDDHVRQETGNRFYDEDENDFLLMQQLHLIGEGRGCAADGNHTSESQSVGYDTSSSSSPLSDLSSDPPHSDDDNSDLNHEELLAPPLDTELSINELLILIEAAQEEQNWDAVDEVKLLVQDAQRTPRKLRTSAQAYLLLTWRTPLWVYSPSTSQTPASISHVDATILRTPVTGSLPSHPEIFVDASSFGVGLVFNQQWLAWKFTSSSLVPLDIHGRVIMSWAELIALELGVLTLIAAGYHDVKVTLRSDNLGVVNAVKEKKWTNSYDLENILQRVLKRCRQSGLKLEVKWVSTKVNPADKPSRGVFPSSSLLFGRAPTLPMYLSHIVEEVLV